MDFIRDNYKLFSPKNMLDFAKPLIDAYDQHKLSYVQVRDPSGPYPYSSRRQYLPKYCEANINKLKKYLYRHQGTMYIKMLSLMEKCPRSYNDIYAALLMPLGKSLGHDQESFFSCEIKGLMEFDHFGKYKRRYFRLTKLGKLVIDIAKKNSVAYCVLRHFAKIDGEDAFIKKMIEVNLDIETMDDTTPDAFIKMVDAVLDESSDLHKIGSYAYWANMLVNSLKKSPDFFNLFWCNEVKAHVDNIINTKNAYPYVRFKDIMENIAAKMRKNVV